MTITVDDVIRDLDAPAGCCDQIVQRERAAMRWQSRGRRRLAERRRLKAELEREAHEKGYSTPLLGGFLGWLLLPVAKAAIQVLLQRLMERLASIKDELDQQG